MVASEGKELTPRKLSFHPLLCCILILGHVTGVLSLVSFGVSNGDTELTTDASPLINLGVSFPFYGSSYSTIMVYQDAYLTFDATSRSLSDLSNTATVDFPCICTFAAQIAVDNDIPGAGHIYYREISDSVLLTEISEIARGFQEFSATFQATRAFVVTWENVGSEFFDQNNFDSINTFQIILATDGTETIAILEYPSIQWIYGSNPVIYEYYDVSEIIISSQMSFYKGDGTSFKNPASFTDDMMQLPSTTNSGQNGRFVYRIDTAPTSVTVKSASTASTATTTTTSSQGSASGSTLGEDERERSIIIGVSVSAAVILIVMVAGAILLFKVKKRNQEKRDRSKTYPAASPAPSFMQYPPLSHQYKIPRPMTSKNGSVINVSEYKLR